MADIRDNDTASQPFGPAISRPTAGHDRASLEAHNPASAPKRAGVGIAHEIMSHLARGGTVTDWRDGRFYFRGAFGSVQFRAADIDTELMDQVRAALSDS